MVDLLHSRGNCLTVPFHIQLGPVFHRAMAGDAFETAVEAHHAEIHRYVVRLTGRTNIGEDLAQETFLRAYRAWRGLPTDANVRAWLFAIATNVCRNHFRSE